MERLHGVFFQGRALGIPLRGPRVSTDGICWIFCNPPPNVLWQQLPQPAPAQAPTKFPGCSLQEWGLGTKEGTSSHPRLQFVKPLNSISYAFSLLPQPVQLISHCDKCSLALNFSSESWLPKCVQKGKSKVMQSWPRWINLNFKSTLVKQFFNTTHLGFPPSTKEHHFRQSENPQFHVSGYVHNIFYFISSHHRELLEIKCLFTF